MLSTEQAQIGSSLLDGFQETLFTQAGAWVGQLFSKKDLSSTPFGYRLRVSGLPRKMWDAYRCDGDVVPDDVALGETRTGIENLVEVGEGDDAVEILQPFCTRCRVPRRSPLHQ